MAWSIRAQAFRNFALSNIERVEVLDRSFERKPAFSLRAYAQRSFGVLQEKPVDVELKFTPKAAIDAREFLFHPTQVMVSDDPRLRALLEHYTIGCLCPKNIGLHERDG